MEPDTAGDIAGALAPPDPVRAALLEIRTLLVIRQALMDQVAVVQRDLDELVGKVRALEGRS